MFDTTLRACGTTVRVLMPMLFLACSIRLGLGLGHHGVSSARMIVLP